MIPFTTIMKKVTSKIYNHSMYTQITIIKMFYLFSLYSIKNKYEVTNQKIHKPVVIVQSQ